MMDARYNLRSGRKGCHISLQVQLATYEEYLTASQGSLDPSYSGQVFSEQSDSESDIDISRLLNHSDQNLSVVDSDNVKHGPATSGCSDPRPSGLNPVEVDQNMINQQMLAQLNVLGNRLDSMEKNSL